MPLGYKNKQFCISKGQKKKINKKINAIRNLQGILLKYPDILFDIY